MKYRKYVCISCGEAMDGRKRYTKTYPYCDEECYRNAEYRRIKNPYF